MQNYTIVYREVKGITVYHFMLDGRERGFYLTHEQAANAAREYKEHADALRILQQGDTLFALGLALSARRK